MEEPKRANLLFLEDIEKCKIEEKGERLINDCDGALSGHHLWT